jgi:hypothetical protein
MFLPPEGMFFDSCFYCRACTLEAVAAALHELEDSPTASVDVASALRFNMRLKVNALLRSKCRIKKDDFISITPTAGYQKKQSHVPGGVDLDAVGTIF